MLRDINAQSAARNLVTAERYLDVYGLLRFIVLSALDIHLHFVDGSGMVVMLEVEYLMLKERGMGHRGARQGYGVNGVGVRGKPEDGAS